MEPARLETPSERIGEGDRRLESPCATMNTSCGAVDRQGESTHVQCRYMGTTTQVAKWGNSLGLRLPKSGAREARLDEGSTVDVSVDNGTIVIRMFMEAGAVHHTPHFHAHYQEDVGVFSLDPVELIAGDLPRAQRRLVEAWAELHQAELKADWERLQAGRPPLPIAPLQ